MDMFLQNWMLRRAMSAPRRGGGDGIEIPSVYQRVEYIQSDGAQYIDLGIAPTGTTKAVLDAQLLEALSGLYMFGLYHPNNVRFLIGTYLSKFHFGAGGESNWTNLSDADTSRHELTVAGDGVCSVDSVIGNTGASTFPTTAMTLYLFSVNIYGNTPTPPRMAVYRCQIYDNDTLVFDGIPCYRKSNGKPGMWDMVSWQFFSNANTSALTDFTVGPDVIQPATKYIVFEDRAVESICVQNFSSDGIGVTFADAAAVTSIGFAFAENANIVSFDELQYFTGVSSLYSAFFYCSSLQSVIVGTDLTLNDSYSIFGRCTSLKYVEFRWLVYSLNDRCFGFGVQNCVIVFRSTTAPSEVQNTAFWGSFGNTIYVPYSADHSVLAAYQTAFSALANYGDAIAGIYELNPDGTIPS